MEAKVKFVVIGVHERDSIIKEMKKKAPNINVFYDPIKNKNCLARTLKVLNEKDVKKYTHICVLQDDLELCYNFEEIVTIMCSQFPNAFFSPYNSRLHFEDKKTSSPYILCKGGACYGQCIIIPTKYVEKINNWVKDRCPPDYPHDDVAMGEFANDNKIQMFATIPSILQHIEPCNSILKYNNKNKVSKVYNGIYAPNFENWLDKNYSIKNVGNSKGMVNELLHKKN